MESTCVYVSDKISHDKDKKAYVKAMRHCYYLCSTQCAGDDTYKMLSVLSKLERNAPSTLMRRFEIFSNTKHHYMLGVAHALDIVRTIHTRFVTGDGHPDTRFVRNILGGRG